MSPGKLIDPKQLSQVILRCSQEILEQMCKAKFSQDPQIAEREIIEYNSRIRALGLDKFNGPCYVAAITMYDSKESLAAKKPCGAFILYLEETIAQEFLKAMSQGLDDEDEEMVMDNCGELCNVIAGQFKNNIKEFGYHDLVISAPTKGKNDIPEGVDFEYNETKLQEVSFFIRKIKAVVIAITLAPAP